MDRSQGGRVKELLRYLFTFSVGILIGIVDRDKAKVLLLISILVFAYVTVFNLFFKEENTP